VRVVDAGVDDADLHAGAGDSVALPGLGSADEGDAVGVLRVERLHSVQRGDSGRLASWARFFCGTETWMPL
jgi:hypothetical protein